VSYLPRIPMGRPCLSPWGKRLVNQCLDEVTLTQGRWVAEFERQWANLQGTRWVVACNSGTAALHLALEALDLGKGDEVAVPALSYVATANAVRHARLRPVFVDIELDTWGMDRAKVPPYIGAEILVPLYGCKPHLPVRYGGEHQRRTPLIVDAAQFIGGDLDPATYTLATWSFYANKVVTMGEGGAVATDVKEYADRMRLLRGQGTNLAKGRWAHEAVGYNYRLMEIPAAIGVSQLKDLSLTLLSWQAAHHYYAGAIADRRVLGAAPSPPGSAAWLYTVVLPADVDRDLVMAAMDADGIDTRPTFPVIPSLPMYYENHWPTKYPYATLVANQGLSLPTYAGMTQGECDRVVESLHRAVAL